MFKRAHHQRIATVLESLDSGRLLAAGALFGGGTAISLRYGEFRESVDIDFVCSSLEGYRTLRTSLTSVGPSDITTRPLALAREPKSDQYGIRMAFSVDGVPVKFEIVLEARIQLDPPAPDLICGVATLSHVDAVATKLLANSDRWRDDSVLSRDLIDLVALVPGGRIPLRAVEKAQLAYGDSILANLVSAKSLLLERDGRLKRCIAGMSVDIPEPVLRARIQSLKVGDEKAHGKERASFEP